MDIQADLCSASVCACCQPGSHTWSCHREQLLKWRRQLAHLFRPHIEESSIIYRRLRSGSMRFQERALIVFDKHYLINLDAIEHIQDVHAVLRKLGQPACEGTEKRGCPCRLQLLLVQLSKSPKGASLTRMLYRRLAEMPPDAQQ